MKRISELANHCDQARTVCGILMQACCVLSDARNSSSGCSIRYEPRIWWVIAFCADLRLYRAIWDQD